MVIKNPIGRTPLTPLLFKQPFTLFFVNKKRNRNVARSLYKSFETKHPTGTTELIKQLP